MYLYIQKKGIRQSAGNDNPEKKECDLKTNKFLIAFMTISSLIFMSCDLIEGFSYEDPDEIIDSTPTEDDSTEDDSTEDDSTEDDSTEDDSTEDNSTEDDSTEEFTMPESGLISTGSDTYKLWLPYDFESDASRSKKYPLLIGLHGGTTLTDHYFQPCIVNDEQQSRDYPCVYMAPNNSNKGFAENAQWIREIIHDLVEDISYQIDTNRIYIIGFSMGAHGTTYMTQDLYSEYGYIAAGIVPMSGGMYSYLTSPEIRNNTAIWTNYGLNGDYSQESDYVEAKIYNNTALESVSSDSVTYTHWDNVEYTHLRETRTLTRTDGVEIFHISTYEGMGHSYSAIFSDTRILNWLFEQSLLQR